MSTDLSAAELIQSGVRMHYSATGYWWVGIQGCVGATAYVCDHHGWLREGTINGAYVSKADGQPIHASDPIVALASAWYQNQMVH